MGLSGGDRILAGDGIELRPHARRNYEIYGRWYSDPTVWHLTSWTAEPLSPREVERLFEDREASTTEKSFAIHLQDNREPLGIISLMNVSKAHGSADLSIIVGDSDDRARGYGTEAIRTILKHAFEDLALYRVGLSVFEFNEAALKTYERLGFNQEGCLRGAVKRDGRHHNAILMSILAREWNA
jgi:RimJ/RimL family protein N-acetyltransferase